jgi:hypothetical protein
VLIKDRLIEGDKAEKLYVIILAYLRLRPPPKAGEPSLTQGVKHRHLYYLVLKIPLSNYRVPV